MCAKSPAWLTAAATCGGHRGAAESETTSFKGEAYDMTILDCELIKWVHDLPVQRDH